jgi:ribosomal-protein-alanine N-acetyltransferase
MASDVNQTKNLIANYYMKEPIGKYAIWLKESNKMIGTIEFRVHEI